MTEAELRAEAKRQLMWGAGGPAWVGSVENMACEIDGEVVSLDRLPLVDLLNLAGMPPQEPTA